MKLLLVLLLAGVSLCARASVVFSDDFQSYSPGVLPESTLTKWLPRSSPNTNDNGTTILTRVDTDSADLFGQGTSNQYLRLADSSTNTALTHNVTNNTLTFGQSGIVSFSFYDPSGDSPTGQGYLLRLGNAAGNANTAFSISIQHGGLFATTGSGLAPAVQPFTKYNLNQKYTLAIAFNNTSSAISYAGGRSLAANTMDVWVNQILVAAGLPKSGGSSGTGIATGMTLTSLSFTQKGSFKGVLYLDDLVVDNAVAMTPALDPTYFSSEVIFRSLQQSAPEWSYTYGSRTINLDQTFPLYTLALEAHVSNATNSAALSPVVAARISHVLSGGHEPECQGGIAGWTHGAFAWTLAFARHTPDVWNALSATEQGKADLLMQALAVASNFCLDDDNNYKCMLDGELNWSKTSNPNIVEGYVGVGLAAEWYFGATALGDFYDDFDFDTFVDDLETAGFTNIVSVWTRTPKTKNALMNGGAFDSGNANYGTGAGVKGNAFTYQTYGIDDTWNVYKVLANRMFSHVVQTELPITGLTGNTYIIDVDSSSNHLISPYEGLTGMCYEFNSTNSTTNGSNFRSSLYYAYEGWMNDMATGLSLYTRGLWPANLDGDTVWDKAEVGSEDFLFKATHGYHGFANGVVQNAYDTNLASATGGWHWARAWWRDVLSLR